MLRFGLRPPPSCLFVLAVLLLAGCRRGSATAGAASRAEEPERLPCSDVLPEAWSHRRFTLAPEGSGTLLIELTDRDRFDAGADGHEGFGETFTRHGVRLSAPLEDLSKEGLVLDVLWRPLWPVDLVSLAGALYGEVGENTVQGLRGWPEEGLVLCELRLAVGGATIAAAQGGFRIPVPSNFGGIAKAELPGDFLELPRGTRRLAFAQLWWDDAEPHVTLAPEGEGLLVDGRAIDPRRWPQPALLLFVRLE